MLTLTLLGTTAIEESDGPVAGRAAHGHRLALLATLALARGRAVSRDKLVALLWPESSPDRARPQLSDALWIVRSALGEGVIRTVGDGLALDHDLIVCDAAEFERLLDDDRPEQAVALYRGPLMDGFHLPGSAEFETWLTAERKRLDQRLASALEALARASGERQDHAAAVGWWRRLAAQDPFNARVALGLMRALDAAGDRAGALQHARVHAALLREEFDAAPDADVAAFAERIRHEATAPSRPAAPPLPDVAHPAPAVESRPSSPAPQPRRRRFAVVAVPLIGLTLILAVAAYGSRRAAATRPAPASVGVLPFVDMSPDAATAYFGDGLSEQIIAALGSVEGLRVAARTSSFALRDLRLQARAIGDTLGVDAVLEGSVRRDGDRVRISAQLVDAETGYPLWAEQYDRTLASILSVQDEIAAAIAAALELRLSPRRSGPRAPPGFQAYDLYLRGLFLRNDLSAESLQQASALFDRVLVLEPGFAEAWAAKASVIAPLIYFAHVPREEGVEELRVLTARALELDPGLGEAHVALGILRLFFDWDWVGAEAALRRAIELNPNDPHAWHHLGNYFSAAGTIHDATAARERAVELDPLNARTRLTLTADYVAAGDFDRAMEHARVGVQLDPVNPLALGLGPALPVGPAEVHLWNGEEEQAVEAFVRVAALRGATAAQMDALRAGREREGMPGFWRSWLELDRQQTGPTLRSMRSAVLHAMIGDTTQLFDALDRALAERDPGLIYLRNNPVFRPYHQHAHMVRILTAMGLQLP